MIRVLHAVVALLVVLAGCSAVPGSGTPELPDHRLSISISNEHDVSYEVSVIGIPDGVEGIDVTYENGSTHRFEVSSFDALPETALRNATSVATTDARELSEAFTVDPNEGIGTTLEGIPANVTVVYFVLPTSDPGTLRGAGVVRCSPDTETTDLEIRIRSDGSMHASLTCRDDPE